MPEHLSRLLGQLNRPALVSAQREIEQQLQSAKERLAELSSVQRIKVARHATRKQIQALEQDLKYVREAIDRHDNTINKDKPKPVAKSVKNRQQKKPVEANPQANGTEPDESSSAAPAGQQQEEEKQEQEA